MGEEGNEDVRCFLGCCNPVEGASLHVGGVGTRCAVLGVCVVIGSPVDRVGEWGGGAGVGWGDAPGGLGFLCGGARPMVVVGEYVLQAQSREWVLEVACEGGEGGLDVLYDPACLPGFDSSLEGVVGCQLHIFL